jgi:thiol-disulfide isomerase/thioredoxin
MVSNKRRRAGTAHVRASAGKAPRGPEAHNRRLRSLIVAATSAAVLGAVIALAAARSGSASGYDTNPTAFVLPVLGTPGKVRLASFQGRPVVVNFFASWCTQCAGELPVFAADARALGGKVAFVEINSEETGDGVAFAKRFDLPTSVTAVAHDVGGSQGSGLYEALGGNGGMPLTAFYSPNGTVLTTHLGAFDSATVASALEQLYGIKPPA